MHSDYLNEKLISDMFVEESSTSVKQQISLNFTVTSREKPHPYQHNSANFMTHALKSLGEFEGWLGQAEEERKKVLLGLEEIEEVVEAKKLEVLSMPDFGLVREAVSRRKVKEESQQQCEQCKQKNIFIQQLEEKLRAQHDSAEINNIKQNLLFSVQKNFFTQEITDLNEQIRQLNEQILQISDQSTLYRNKIEQMKEIIEKSNLEKSTLFDRTKNLEKRLESMQKSFSNAKNSTACNDTLNRADSILFQSSDLGMDELLKAFEKGREECRRECYRFVADQQARASRGFSDQEKREILKKAPQHELFRIYKNLSTNLKSLKEQKCPLSLEFKSRELVHTSEEGFMSVNQEMSISKDLKSMKMRNECLENSIKNIKEMYTKARKNVEECVKKNKDLEEKLENMNEEMKRMEENKEQMQRKCEKILIVAKKEQKRLKTENRELIMQLRRKMIERKKLIYQIEDLKGSIRVYCRIRPRMGAEVRHPSTIKKIEHEKLTFKDFKDYQFDHIFDQYAPQNQIFQQTQRLVECAFDGHNVCIFAYGQTGSGKTHTLHGTQADPGLARSIINEVFGIVEGEREHFRTVISMGMIQIYLDTIYNLYGIVQRENKKIEIKQEKNSGIYLENCPLITLKNKQEMLKVYEEGMDRRTTGMTEKNEKSSRSHCVMIINIARENLKTREVRYSKITLIDLAGAEKLTSSNPIQVKETTFINSSLTALSKVLSSMRTKKQHVPYRDNKLTHILKDSLCSKGKILLFVNVSPSECTSGETQRSLEFGSRVRGIERQTHHKTQQHQEPEISRPKHEKSGQRISRRGSSRMSIS